MTGSLHVGEMLDYHPVDVWFLGCTLFAILYRASAIKCEFCTTTTTQEAAGMSGNHHYGQIHKTTMRMMPVCLHCSKACTGQ